MAGDVVARGGGGPAPDRPDPARRVRGRAAAGTRPRPGVTWPDVLSALVAGSDLTAEQTTWAMGEILSGEATPAQIAGFAVALRAKGETIDEVTGLVEAMYARRTPISVPGRLLDVVGTGGDRSMSVNISTMAAIVAAGAGAKVVKHGSRSASSQSGSADVLEALGIRLDLPSDRVAGVAEQAGITFCFAAAFNPAMRHTAVPRRELGIATTFNILGPLANPARPDAQAIGCADARMAPVMAGVFARRGADAWVVRGDDGLDELTTTTTSSVWHVHDGEVTTATVDPAALGLAPATTADLRGGDAAHNADVVRRMLAAEPGPVRDAVVLNAGAALAVHADPGASVEDALPAGIERAIQAIDSGAAQATLERWVAATAQ
nr:anthranilate phosphoribosyltransferase [Nocardioides lijunqiniae]